MFGMGIPHVGIETACALVDHFYSLDKLMNASLLQLQTLDSIGDSTAKSVHQFFSKQENIDLCNDLIKVGVITKKVEPSADSATSHSQLPEKVRL